MPINATNAQENAAADKAYWDSVKNQRTKSATVNTGTDANGNAVTNSVDNSQLTNNDFLKLMLEELKQQDPTKPQDSAALMDSQLKMSTIQSNQDMATAMTALQASYANSALSTAANMIGHGIKTGETNDKGEDKIYKVVSVDNKDGELYAKSQEFVGIVDRLQNAETEEIVAFDENGLIYEDNATTDYKISLNAEGRFNYNDDGTLKILDLDNEVVTDESITSKYTYGGYSQLYSTKTTDIPLSAITAVS